MTPDELTSQTTKLQSHARLPAAASLRAQKLLAISECGPSLKRQSVVAIGGVRHGQRPESMSCRPSWKRSSALVVRIVGNAWDVSGNRVGSAPV